MPALLLALVTLAQVALGNPAVEGPVAYAVGPRDVLKVVVVGEPELSGNITVLEDGTIRLAYLDLIEVEDMSSAEIAKRLTEAYSDGVLVNPEIRVEIVEHRSRPYEVLGAVKNPGTFYLTRPTTLREAVNNAGWIDASKSSNLVMVRHGDGSTELATVDDVAAGAAGDRPVMPRDVISVEQGQVVYVGGQVQRAGPVAYRDGLTVADALLKAGGPTATARLRGAYIVRNGEKVPVKLKKILAGRAPDIAMIPGDRLFLKESPI